MRFHALALMGAILALAGCLSACNTQQQRTIVTVGCAVDAFAVPVAQAVATITAPESVALIAAASAADKPVHSAVQAACANAMAGSKPIPGTVETVDVPVGAPSPAVTLVTFPVSAPAK